MKKVICFLFVMVLCMTTAMAESVPSKSTADMTQFSAVAENQPVETGFFVRAVDVSEEDYQEHIDICQKEINKLMEGESIEAYFGEVKDAEGNVTSLKELLETETLNVFEFCPLIAGEYEEHFGKVVVKMLFSTPYEKDQKVAVMVGLTTVNDDETQTVAWSVYEGIGVEAEGVEEMGCIQVELDPEIVLAVQEGTALLAVVSQ